MPPAPLLRLLLGLLVAVSACAGLDHGVYTKSASRYRIGAVPPSWQLLRMQGNDVVYLSKDSPHTLAINATCKDHDDPSLEVLTRHLLMGFTDQQVVRAETGWLDGRQALRTRVVARLDGVPVELLLVVMKKDHCVYDFSYLSPPGRVAERLETFEQVLANFKTESRS